MRILSLMAAAVTALSAMPLFAYAKDMPDVGAKAAVVMDADSGEVLFSKNEFTLSVSTMSSVWGAGRL